MKRDQILAVVPARYASTRFPGKPLTPILGKPLLQWVWEGAKKAQKIDRVIVATDDDRIAKAAEGFGAEVKMTRDDHPSGTDRIAEATNGMDAAWILNIQGDEPLIEGPLLDQWISGFQPSFGMATVATPLSKPAYLQKPDIVKVSFDPQGRALGFQRQVPMDQAKKWAHQHVGLYAYTPEILRKFVSRLRFKSFRLPSYSSVWTRRGTCHARNVPWPTAPPVSPNEIYLHYRRGDQLLGQGAYGCRPRNPAGTTRPEGGADEV
ncbi:MAG: 3-deoxy-manno-octulosonate cytidylyltransferase [Verrucomicrobia bacterium]|nr:3-deoxy-manno-octulosonate cytidylyltransferase [Verrucomicrobiota bacterium]